MLRHAGVTHFTGIILVLHSRLMVYCLIYFTAIVHEIADGYIYFYCSACFYCTLSKWRNKDVQSINTLRPIQDAQLFADDIFKCIFLNENIIILSKNSLKFVPKVPINNILALVQIMAWRRPGYRPSSEPMMVRLPTQKCVRRHQWFDSLVLDYLWRRDAESVIWKKIAIWGWQTPQLPRPERP